MAIKQSPSRYTKSELLSEYVDPHWRMRYARLSNLRDFFRGCILARNYTVPDPMNKAIVLSEHGQQFQQELVTKHKVNAKDARIQSFLMLAYVEPLVDVEKTDITALRESLEQQLKARRIYIPHAYGRDMYDRGFKQFDHETPRLTFDETLKLLEDSPIGFSQLGEMTTGPLGVLDSEERRWIHPRRRVPFYSCSNLGCNWIHETELQTNYSCSVNSCGHEVAMVLEQISERPSEWGEFELDILNIEREIHNDMSTSSLHFLVGDAFSVAEMKVVASELLDKTAAGSLRQKLEGLGLRGSSASILESTDHATLLQIIMLCSDSIIIKTIDGLIRRKEIHVPENEIRRPVLNGGYSRGTFALRPELGAHGVRFMGSNEDLAPLRLQRLIRDLYPRDDVSARDEFDWQLRGTEAPTADERLEEFLRTNEPQELVGRVVLAKRSHMLKAAETLGILSPSDLSDREAIDTILWECGYNIEASGDFNAKFWSLHGMLTGAVQMATSNRPEELDRVADLARRMFIELEGVLDDCLGFTTWLLCSEVFESLQPFAYQPEKDRLASFSLLDSFSANRIAPGDAVKFGAHNELWALTQGFRILADFLDELHEKGVARLRPIENLPVSINGSNLRRYPFLHNATYLDLTPEAQKKVRDLLRQVSKSMTSSELSSVRNDWHHFRRQEVDLERLSAALVAIQSVVLSLEGAGMCRILFRMDEYRADRWGRERYALCDARGRKIEIMLPSRLELGQLPNLRDRQYLVTIAQLAPSGEFLRCSLEPETAYSQFWMGFPSRRLVPDVASGSGSNETRPDHAAN